MNRRALLSSLGVCAAASLAGCSGYFDRTTGTVFRKNASVAVQTQRGPVWTSLAVIVGGVDDRDVLIHYDPEYVSVDTDAVEMTITDEQRDRLDRDFIGSSYIAGLIPDGKEQGPIRELHRPEFNEMRVGGKATVSQYTTEEGSTYFRLHGTDPRPNELSISHLSRIPATNRS
ncbi:hypothetical protein [Halomarina rubra]|uniref:Uncharacterized protein n=1 Tax=Halomarina rubra TaxID=2071873 RepID=A0ABD6AW66_9EURY|nr:hypothetical protein [Halomarina rubra]